MISTTCSNCGRRYQAPDAMAGKKVRCKQCGAVFALPGEDLDAAPDDALSEFEKTLASLDTAGPESESDPHGATSIETIENEEGAEAAEGAPPGDSGEVYDVVPEEHFRRPNVPFRFPYARQVDQWLGPLLVVGGLAWAYSAIAHADDNVPAWLSVVRFAVVLLFYTILIAPLTSAGISKAATALRYHLPRRPLWRAFATFMPAFTLAVVMWNVGGGSVMALFMGAVLGLVTSGGVLYLLFRLQPQEIATTAGYASAGFFVGTAVTGAVLFGMNTLLVYGMRDLKKPNSLIASPFGQAFERPPTFKGELASNPTTNAVVIGSEDSPTTPGPTEPTDPAVDPTPSPTPPEQVAIAPTPPPQVTSKPAPIDHTGELFPDVPGTAHPDQPAEVKSPLIAKADAAPLEGSFETILRPLLSSPVMAVVRKGSAETVPIELWDETSFTKKASASFSGANTAIDANYAVSTDGDRLVRIATFPKLSLQVWSFNENRIVKSIPIPDGTAAPKFIGFLSDTRLLQRIEATNTILEWLDVSTPQRFRNIDTALQVSPSGATVALAPNGATVAVAGKFRGEPSIQVFNVENGALQKRIPIGIDRKLDVAPTGMAFSPDGTQLAALFENQGNWLIVNYRPDSGRLLAEHTYPAAPIAPPAAPRKFAGSALIWLADAKSWLVYGDGVIDAANGRLVSRIGIHNVVGARFIAADTVDLTVDESPDNRKLMRVKLDLSKLAPPGAATRAAR